MARVRKAQINEAHKEAPVWKIAVYIRLSRDDGSDESESVVNQKKILKEYLEHFFDDPHEIVDYYIDDGLTGTDDTRASFMRMIQDIEQGKVSCVICKTLSRAFRNYSDQGYYIEYYFQQKNVRFISTGDPKIDTYKNPEAITGLEVPISGLMNDRYSARTSGDIRRTFNTKRRNGEFIGAFPPYGYLKSPVNKNKLVLDPDIVPVKRDMLDWVISGMSLSGVARKLNELGIPNPTAYKRSLGWKYSNPRGEMNDGLWTSSTVKNILADKVNIGHMIQGKQRVVSYKVHDKIAVPEDEWFIKENTHEPTFSLDEYDALMRVLSRDTRTANGKNTVYLFSGFLRCADCGKALTRRSAKGIMYYACRTYADKSKTKCTKHSIRLDKLENAVLKTIQIQVGLVDDLAAVVGRINENAQAGAKTVCIEKLLTEKQRELVKLRSATDSLYVDWKAGEITREEYKRMKARFDDRIDQLNNSMAKLDDEQRNIDAGMTPGSTIFSEFCRIGNITKLDRNILIELIDTIYVHENNEITVKFRYEDQLQRVYEF